MLESFMAGLQAWLWPGFAVVLAVLVIYGVYRLVLALVRRFSESTSVARVFLDAAARALGVFVCVVAFNAVLHAAPEDLPLLGALQHLASLLLILSLTWATVRCSSAIGDVILLLNPVLEQNWLRARKVETQTRVLIHGLNILIIIVGTGAALMTFEPVQQVGTTLLASAGIGGLVLGFAARPVLSNMLAGVQLALTQPLRIDDVLRVQGEWCWVEEVTATYVVLRVWDLRRLIVPLQWFIENPFENWSRRTTDMVGAVTLWVDYSMPVEPLREVFSRLLGGSSLWDGKTQSVQVVESGERGLQIRFLMSARSSTQLWDLRCAIREGLVGFMKEHYPDYLPRLRAQMVAASESEEGASVRQ